MEFDQPQIAFRDHRRTQNRYECLTLNPASLAAYRHGMKHRLRRRSLDEVSAVKRRHNRASAMNGTKAAGVVGGVELGRAKGDVVTVENWTAGAPDIVEADVAVALTRRGRALLNHRLVEGVPSRFDDLLGLAREQVNRPLIVEPAAGGGEPPCSLPTIKTEWLENRQHTGDYGPWVSVGAELEAWIEPGSAMVDCEDPSCSQPA